MKKIMVPLRLLFLVLLVILIKSQALLWWLGLYALSLIFPTLLGKRVYCMVICPINTVMGGVQWLKKKKGIATKPAPSWAKGKWLPWVMLAATAALFLITRGKLNKPLPVMLLWIGIAALMTWNAHPDTFHDGVCPYGAPQRALAEVSLLSEQNRSINRNYQGFTNTVLQGPQSPAERGSKA